MKKGKVDALREASNRLGLICTNAIFDMSEAIAELAETCDTVSEFESLAHILRSRLEEIPNGLFAAALKKSKQNIKIEHQFIDDAGYALKEI